MFTAHISLGGLLCLLCCSFRMQDPSYPVTVTLKPPLFWSLEVHSGGVGTHHLFKLSAKSAASVIFIET